MYQTFQPFYPNRSIRRAIKQGRESRLPGEWRQALFAFKGLREMIQKL